MGKPETRKPQMYSLRESVTGDAMGMPEGSIYLSIEWAEGYEDALLITLAKLTWLTQERIKQHQRICTFSRMGEHLLGQEGE